MRYPRGTEDQRASMWLEHTRRQRLEGSGGRQAPTTGRASPTTAGRSRDGAHCSASPTATAGPPTSGGSSRWSTVCGAAGWPHADIDRADDELLRTDRTAHPSRAPRAGASARRWPGGCSAAAPRATCCSPPPRSTARPTAPGGCTAGWDSPTSSATTTSPAIRAPFAILGRGCRSNPLSLPIGAIAWSGTMTGCSPPSTAPPQTSAGAGAVAAARRRPAGRRLRARPGVDHRLPRRPGVRADHRGGQTPRRPGQGPAAVQRRAVRPEGRGLGVQPATATSAPRRCSPT